MKEFEIRLKRKCEKCGCKLSNHERGQFTFKYRCLDEYIPNTTQRKWCECVLTERQYFKQYKKKLSKEELILIDLKNENI